MGFRKFVFFLLFLVSQPYVSASPRGIKILEGIDWEKLSAIQRQLLDEFARIAQKQRARFGDGSKCSK